MIRLQSILTLFAFSYVCLYFFLSGIPGIFTLEFVGRTEADRTLIAWEMYKRGDLLVPYLLGDVYVTKPPVFYTLLASIFLFVGSPEVWAARMPSLVAATLTSVCQFMFLRRVGWTAQKALLAACMLLSSAEFLAYSLRAEIDMLFVLECTLALQFAYVLFYSQRKLVFAPIACIISLLLALFTKGPPVLIFFWGAFLSSVVWQAVLRRQEFAFWFIRQLCWQLVLFTFAMTLLAAWCLHLAGVVPTEDLFMRFDQEILGRFREHAGRNFGRGVGYYVFGFFASSFPWSLLPLLLIQPSKFSGTTLKRAWGSARTIFKEKPLLCHSLGIVLFSLFFFSLAESKANRYLLPLLPWWCVLLTSLVWPSRGLLVGKLVEPLVFCGVLLSTVFAVVSFSYHSPLLALMYITCFVLPFIGLYCTRSSGLSFSMGRLVFLVCCVLGLRLVYAAAYSPYRNEQLSVVKIASEIDSRLPAVSTLYTLEMWQRWLAYYLEKEGRKVKRLTPALASAEQENDKAFLLLSSQDEQWRLKQVHGLDSEARLLYRAATAKHEYYLIQIDAKKLADLNPERLFPVNPSHVPPGLEVEGNDVETTLARLSSQ